MSEEKDEVMIEDKEVALSDRHHRQLSARKKEQPDDPPPEQKELKKE